MRFRKFLTLLTVLVSLLVLAPSVCSAGSDSLEATFETVLVSVSLDKESIDYGPVPLGTVNARPVGDPVITAKNDGTVVENFKIRGDRAYEASNGNQLELICSEPMQQNNYCHKYGLGSDPADGSLNSLSHDSDSGMVDNVAVDGAQPFKLRISMAPNFTFGYGRTFTTTVTVTALQK